ncbi:MAG: hypothetical protein JOY57_07715 [Actinobacteria bacterium]|nr:hypothetical protein [Actinomycetota bacterium]
MAASRSRVEWGRVGGLLLLVGNILLAGALFAPTAHADPKGVAKGWHEKNDAPATTVAAAAPTTVAAAASNSSDSSCGSYCPSGVGLPSGNGNGNGNATGKPCAGCVGNADGKNPPGQYKDGSDHNNGYECDGNNGIGKTNPAHSGCHTTTTAPHTTTTKPATTTTAPHTTTTVGQTTTTVGQTTTTAPGVTTTVGPTTSTTAGANVLGVQFNRDPAATALARTGSNASPLFALGLLLEVAGATLVVIARRRRAMTTSAHHPG